MGKRQTAYVFVGNQGIGSNAISPSSAWAKSDICTALQLATGPILCIFDGQAFVAAIDASKALVKFGFKHAYPLVKASESKDVRNIGRIAFRYWAGELKPSDVQKAQIHYANKYGRRFETAEYVAAWRLLSVKPHEVGTAPLLAGLRLNQPTLVASLKSRVKGYLD